MIIIKHIETGVTRRIPSGWSWTTLVFGFFPALFRGDLKWAFIQVISHIALGLLTFGIGNIILLFVFPAIYNKMYLKDQEDRGYVVVDINSSNQLDMYKPLPAEEIT